MGLERWCQRIKPVNRIHEVRQRIGGNDVLDTYWNYGNALANGALDFTSDLWGLVCVGREYQDQHTAMI